MTDKSKELVSIVKLVNDKLHFMGSVDETEPISIDYIKPLGDDLGYTSLELLLLSLSSCVGSAVLTFLRRMNRKIMSCEICSRGIRREEHPMGFKLIELEIRISSPDISDDDMKKVISLAEDKYCPVYSMIKGNVEVRITHHITSQT
ncbi:MAG: OsmC family protein [Bacteroidales bacterium]